MSIYKNTQSNYYPGQTIKLNNLQVAVETLKNKERTKKLNNLEQAKIALENRGKILIEPTPNGNKFFDLYRNPFNGETPKFVPKREEDELKAETMNELLKWAKLHYDSEKDGESERERIQRYFSGNGKFGPGV